MKHLREYKKRAVETLDVKTPELDFAGRVMFSEIAPKTPASKIFAMVIPAFSAVAGLALVIGIALGRGRFLTGDRSGMPSYYMNAPEARVSASTWANLDSREVYNDFVMTFSPLVFKSEEAFAARSFSPVDAFVNIAILGYTSVGSVQSEILDALGVADIQELNEVTKDVVSVLGSDAGYALNSFWYDDDEYDLSEDSGDLLSVLSANYYSNVIARRPTSALVNEWLDLYVPAEIFPIIPEVELSEDGADAAIVSSYFAKSEWSAPSLGQNFEDQYESGSHKMTFMAPDQSTQVDYVEYGGVKISADGFEGVSIALDKFDIEFYLPDEGSSVLDIFDDAINRRYDAAGSETTGADIPYFEIENKLNLMPSISEFGINSILSHGAGQALLSGDNGIQVTKSTQFSYMSFDYGGLYSASVTVTELNDVAGYDFSSEASRIVFDRPFAFSAFYHGAIILVGQVFNPLYR